MFLRIIRFCDKIFAKGLQIGDPLYFIERIVTWYFTNNFIFVIMYITFMFSSLEVICQLYLLITEKSDVNEVFQLAPMCATSLYVLFSGVPLLTTREDYKIIIKQAREYLKPRLALASKPTLKILIQIFYNQIALYIFFGFCGVISIASFIPIGGIDYEKTIWPSIAMLRLIPSDSQVFIMVIIIVTYGCMGAKGFCAVFYGIHFMHLCTLYQFQNILLDDQLKAINCSAWTNDFVLNDDNKYQKSMEVKIKYCIMDYIDIIRFGKRLEYHFKYVMLFQIFSGLLLLTVLFYITYYLKGGISPIGYSNYVFGTFWMIFVFIYHSEVYNEQKHNIRDALFNIPWYTFNSSNRQLLLIFVTNISPKSNYLTCGGIFEINYNLFIWVLHKMFSLLTAMARMTDIGNDE